MIIKFNDTKEFVSELEREFKKLDAGPIPVAKPIMRLTAMRKNIPSSPLRFLTVVATIKSMSDPGDIIQFEHLCGYLYGGDLYECGDENEKAFARAKKVGDEVTVACKNLGIEVCPGMLELGK